MANRKNSSSHMKLEYQKTLLNGGDVTASAASAVPQVGRGFGNDKYIDFDFDDDEIATKPTVDPRKKPGVGLSKAAKAINNLKRKKVAEPPRFAAPDPNNPSAQDRLKINETKLK